MRMKLSPSLVLSVIAIFIALGGTSYAISQLPKNSVGAKQIRKNAVNSNKVKDRSLLARDFKEGQLPAGKPGPAGNPGPAGPAGATGATGPSGEAGSALAFARVVGFSGVSIPPASAKNLTSEMVSRPEGDPAGVYCFDLESLPEVKNVQVTVETNVGTFSDNDRYATAVLSPINTNFEISCPDTSDLLVAVRDQSSNNFVNASFYLVLN